MSPHVTTEPSSLTAAKAPQFPTTWRTPLVKWSRLHTLGDDRAVFFHCSLHRDHVEDTAGQLGLDFVALQGDDRAVFFHCSKGVVRRGDVEDTGGQQGSDLVGVPSTIFVAPGDD